MQLRENVMNYYGKSIKIQKTCKKKKVVKFDVFVIKNFENKIVFILFLRICFPFKQKGKQIY